MSGVILAETATGQTVESLIMDMATGFMWNGSALEAYNSAHYVSEYGVNMPEQSGSGRYLLTIPAGLPAGNYWASPYLLTTPPNLTLGGDTPLDILRFGWDGTNIIDLASALNVGKVNGSSVAAVNLGVSAAAMIVGAAAAGTLSTSQMTTNLSQTVANILAGRVLIFTSGVNAGLAVLITAYAVTGGKLTFVAYGNLPAPSAPSAADAFIIL